MKTGDKQRKKSISLFRNNSDSSSVNDAAPAPAPCNSIYSFIMMPLSVPQPVINSDAMTELIYFPQLISLAISFLCRVKENCALKYQSLSLAVTMRWRLQKSENCEDATLSAEIRWNFSQLDDSDGVCLGEGVTAANKRSRRVLESTVSRLSRWTFMLFMLRRFFHATKMIFANDSRQTKGELL